MMQIPRRFPLAPPRYARPFADLSPRRIRNMALPAVLATVVHVLANGPIGASLPLAPQNAPN